MDKILVFLLFTSSFLFSACSRKQETGSQMEHVQLTINYFKGKKIAFTLPDQYQATISPNLVVYPEVDSIEVRAIEKGDGYLLIRKNTDTLLFVSVIASANTEVENALALVATNDPMKYRNNQLASWLYGMGLQNRGLPDFTIQSIDGSIITSNRIKGKVSMIHFWYYGCPACMLEMDALEDIGNWLHENPQYEFISICKDSGYIKDGTPYFFSERNVINKNGNSRVVSYQNVSFKATHCINGETLENAFSFSGYPITFLTDKKGIIRYVFNGSTKDMFTKTKACMTFLQHLE